MTKTDDDARVRLSSKGQLVVPARIRRRLGWVAGRILQLRVDQGQLTLNLLDEDKSSVDDMLKRMRTLARRSGRDLVEELHERRRAERREEVRRARRGH